MKPIEYIGRFIAKKLNVPPLAVTMFKKANEISGINKETLPTELIPLNTVQLSRGLLNFTLLQSIRTWVLPYWAERQYDPGACSFIPRSHFGLSMNVTHRNWTGVGSMECDNEAIVDPRGLLTPFRDGWSIDVWMVVNGTPFFPSRSIDVRQRLVEDLPIVETGFTIGNLTLTLTAFVVKAELVYRASVRNGGGTSERCTLFFALRPFNPEGISLVQEVECDADERCMTVNKTVRIHFDARPDMTRCSGFGDGDCANSLSENYPGAPKTSILCDVGLANAIAGFAMTLAPLESKSIAATCLLEEGGRQTAPGQEEAVQSWNHIVEQGSKLTTPDQKINSLFMSSVTSLLLLVDNESITPGPFTYHQFWFRDAAYMIWALDKVGYPHFTEPVIKSFARKQTRAGYFRSQQGEWDSNGQVMWSAWQHLLYTSNVPFATAQYVSLQQGVKWIEEKRHSHVGNGKEKFPGLMPRGLSAEHLGLADLYFWDNFWSLAGLEAYTAICAQIGRQMEADRVKKLSDRYREDIEEAIAGANEKYKTKAITAGPLRGIDCGMIGSVSAWYPLQVLKPDIRLTETLRLLNESFFVKGMFFQDFIHSGMNIYLTLQIAHAWLYAGEREKFWNLFSTACAYASPTMNFPEAISTVTGGGCMGDGHHGWAAAEVVLALRDAFVYERKNSDGQTFDLLALAGLPPAWFSPGMRFSVERIPIPGGTITIRAICGETINLAIQLDVSDKSTLRRLVLSLPVIAREVHSQDGRILVHTISKNETTIEVDVESVIVLIGL